MAGCTHCGTDCTGCGDCRNWGNYSCGCSDDGCSGCGGACSSSCSGCSGTCNNTCKGTCSNTCNNTCKDTCTGTCNNTCTGGCKDNCGRGCNTGCTSNEAVELYNTLVAGLNQTIYAADMANINRMIEIEASSDRKNVSITSVSFVTGNKATSADIEQMQSNLSEIGQSATSSANVGNNIALATGDELRLKAIESAEMKIAN